MSDVRILDIAPLFGDASPDRFTVDKALWEAFRETGSVIVTNLPDGDKLGERAHAALGSTSCRRRRSARSGGAPWNPTAPSSIAATTPAWITAGPTTRFSTSPPRRRSRVRSCRSDALIEATPWPDPPPFPGMARESVMAYYRQMDRIARAVMLSVGRSCGFDDTAIAARLVGANSTLPHQLSGPPESGDARRRGLERGGRTAFLPPAHGSSPACRCCGRRNPAFRRKRRRVSGTTCRLWRAGSPSISAT